MTKELTGSSASKRDRGIRIALAVSVALNLAVIGVIAGAMMGPDGPRSHWTPRDLGFGYFNDALRPEDRADLRRRFTALRPGMIEERRARRQDLQALLAALRADPFDASALDAAITAQTSRLQGRLATGQTLLRDFLADLPAEDRKDFADRLENTAFRRGPAP